MIIKGAKMNSMNDLYKTADWKSEKHVPVIEVTSDVVKGQDITVNVAVGKEIPHPNTTEHHIESIDVYFFPENSKFPYRIGQYMLSAHGASTNGPNTSTVYSVPNITINFKTDDPGTIIASSYCNIHGLWENTKKIVF
jgi:superoxide reductase